MKTSQQVSRELSVTDRTIRRWCVRLGFSKVGRDYILTDGQVMMIQDLCQPKRGRPRIQSLRED